VIWLAPPPALHSGGDSKNRKRKYKCTIVVPGWTSAPFWFMLIENQEIFDVYLCKRVCTFKDFTVFAEVMDRNSSMFGKQRVLFKIPFVHIEY
jgi:hypothetical protein